MSDPWKPQGEVERLMWGVELQYLRGPRKMGAHDVAFPGPWTLRVLPDSRTSGRARSDAVRHAVAGFVEGDRGMIALVEQVVGALVLHGATNLELNGEDGWIPLIEQGGGKWMVLLEDNGRMEARYVKGTQ